MIELVRIGYNAGLGFGLGLLVALAFGLGVWGTLNILITWLGKKIGHAIDKWKMKRKSVPTQKPETKTEPKVFMVPSEKYVAELNKPLLVGAILFKPKDVTQNSQCDVTGDKRITITYESDQGSLAALTVNLTQAELMSLKR